MASDSSGTWKAMPSFGDLAISAFGVGASSHPPSNNQKQSPRSKGSLCKRSFFFIQFASLIAIVPERFLIKCRVDLPNGERTVSEIASSPSGIEKNRSVDDPVK